MLPLELTFQRFEITAGCFPAADEEVRFARPERWRNMQTAQIATTHIGCQGRYIRLGDQEMFDYCFPFLEVWEEKKRPLLISALHFLVITVMETLPGNLLFWPLSLNLLAELMAFRQAVSTFHCFSFGCSVLLISLNSDNDYDNDNDSYHSLILALFLALS